MQPLQYDLRCSVAKDNSITHWVAKHNRTTRNSIGNCTSKTGSRRQSRKKTILKHFLKGFLKEKNTTVKIARIYSQITIAAWMQPIQYDLRCSAAKDNSITHAAAAPSNLDAATTMRSADTELQNTIELRATVSEIAPPKPGCRRQSRKKTILKHFLKGFLKGKLRPWKLRKSTRKSLSQPGCSHSNTIYDVQLQKTIVLRMQPASSPKHSPCNIHAAIPMRSATTASGNA